MTIGRTTLIIAHRLSTIRYADKIIVMQKGEVIEYGDHDSLMQNQDIYFELVKQQSLRQAQEEEELEFEQEEITKSLLADQIDSNSLDVRRDRGSTIVSLSPSVLVALYGKRNSRVDEDLEEKNSETNEKTKV